ncbi:TetR/AcrR family transcriptional regulator [Paenalcaligenes niemegkensis]|uniref:TetR/AcrR family transcriptional regulator n=1 Tax=Paenalcaligenes niemegkensis TaxID=2895469 RepID=UPI001EE7982F|nr:TetR/AcrR family transcriptional regulator [Paenalcaligenes niemegkensis]MCQ9617790.1 TetR/AcrR family transcriptional regulator [Paenalcaligenes niemegkensis]
MKTKRQSTRERILNAAEQLFAQHGHENTTMRQITSTADVNLSAVNYHFGSKDSLIQAVFKRRLEAINEERLQIIEKLEAEAGGAPLKPSQIVEGFFGPLIRHALGSGRGKRAFLPLLERSTSDPDGFIRAIFDEAHASVFDRYKDALFLSLVGVPEEEIIWRFHFMLGSVSYALMGTDQLRHAINAAPSSASQADENQQLQARLMGFLLGGLRAPLPEP